MTIDEMRERKRELGYTNQMIADKAGLPLSTVQKIFAGATASPRRETILALERILAPQQDHAYDTEAARGNHPHPSDAAALHRDYPYLSEPTAQRVQESLAQYGAKKPGGYTLEDYMALPDDIRVELIDGVFYEMFAPTTNHQAIAGYLHKIFLDHVLEHKGPCYPFIAPVDVQLDRDDRTIVQPDVMIVCDRDKYRNGRIFGAPDLIVEVLSPSTRKKDMQLKLHKYGNAGVREYWMIDPKKKVVIQHDLEHMEIPVIYSFDDIVPVLIWDSVCRVDFRELFASVSFLWEASPE